MSGHIDARPRMFQEASFCDDPEAADLTGRPGHGAGVLVRHSAASKCAPGTRGEGSRARSGGLRSRSPRCPAGQCLVLTRPADPMHPYRPPSLSPPSACFVNGGSYAPGTPVRPAHSWPGRRRVGPGIRRVLRGPDPRGCRLPLALRTAIVAIMAGSLCMPP